MYILIKAYEGIISDENEVSTYDTYNKAFDAMVEDVHKELVEELDEDFEYDKYGRPQMQSRDGDLYCIDAMHSYVMACSGPEWQIFEV